MKLIPGEAGDVEVCDANAMLRVHHISKSLFSPVILSVVPSGIRTIRDLIFWLVWSFRCFLL